MKTYAEKKAEELCDRVQQASGQLIRPALAELLVREVLEDAACLVEHEVGDLRTATNLLRNMADRRAEIPLALARASDHAELTWWRSQFATRFASGELPKPGTPLTGRRFRLRGWREIEPDAPGAGPEDDPG